MPTFLTRNVTGVLRLRDGEAALIGGLVQSNETVDAAGVLGVGEHPHTRQAVRHPQAAVQGLRGRHLHDAARRRAPKLVESDFRSLSVGTQEVPRVQGARPGLFGKEPEAPEAATGARRGERALPP